MITTRPTPAHLRTPDNRPKSQWPELAKLRKPRPEPTPFMPETMDELRATVQGMRDGLTQSLNAIPSGHGNAVSGMIEHKWQARREALTEVLTMIDHVQAAQKAAQPRSWLKRITDSLSMTSPL